MANIAITKYCNLKCPYCFAEDMMTEKDKKNIDLNILKNILSWLEKTPRERVGLIGGEPTLHPQFKEILSIVNNHCSKNNTDSILFTNGINLQPFLQYISPQMSVLININSPKNMSEDYFLALNKVLNILYLKNKLSEENSQFTCGCNLCLEIEDYSFFWDIIDKFKIKRVRVSVTAPMNFEYKQNKELYYTKLKPVFLNFILNAYYRKVKVGIDCNHIPDCYFTDLELSLIKKVTNKDIINDFCIPCVDITADFKASPCFGSYDSLIDCNKFNNCEELRNFFLKGVIVDKTNNNNFGKCNDCIEFKNKKCQGGCLSFSKLSKND
ncbi:MAG: 4Fe-4S cluster-binding domain-containing protein [Firmicutes bacterium]|nr:4Fe-4S cluster-binding domain-containing protein [Bacillota bacterium]